MFKFFKKKQAPMTELTENPRIELGQAFAEWERAMEILFQKANELCEAIKNTPYDITLTVTRTKFYITEERNYGDTYSLQNDREDKGEYGQTEGRPREKI